MSNFINNQIKQFVGNLSNKELSELDNETQIKVLDSFSQEHLNKLVDELKGNDKDADKDTHKIRRMINNSQGIMNAHNNEFENLV